MANIVMKGSVEIQEELKRLQSLLLSKNEAYGDSALRYGAVFPISPEESIKSRINDKIARIINKGLDDKTEDTVDDLIGYLVLLNISRKVCRTCNVKLTDPSPYCSANIHTYNNEI